MDLGDLNKVWEIKALKTKPAAEVAKNMLEKIAKQVQPIMRKHKWRVKVLSEFCPTDPRLLGVNVGGGVNVKLRLRRPNRDWDFLPFDDVLDTMLHELCHNAHGPHNASFYKLWDELRKECEELMAKGISGSAQGFDLTGRRLGGFSRQPPLPSLRRTALAAAEKRAKIGSLLPSKPQRLGGDSNIMDALSPIQAAAMAAERRLQDEIWCGSQNAEVIMDEERNSDVAEEDIRRSSAVYTGQKRDREPSGSTSLPSPDGNSVPSFIDLSTDASTSGSTFDCCTCSRKKTCNSNKTSSANSSHAEASFVDLTADLPFHSKPIHNTTENPQEPTRWECGMCTLLNPPLAPLCEVCGTKKPEEDASAKYKMWSCKFCTLENSVKIDKCSACGQWRYSYGAPITTHAPNRGT